MDATELMEEGTSPKKEEKLIVFSVVKKVLARWKKDEKFDFGDCEPIALMNVLNRQKKRLLNNEEYELMPDTEKCITELQKFIDQYQ